VSQKTHNALDGWEPGSLAHERNECVRRPHNNALALRHNDLEWKNAPDPWGFVWKARGRAHFGSIILYVNVRSSCICAREHGQNERSRHTNSLNWLNMRTR